MQFQQLGNTGVFVSRLCLGTMTFGGVGTVFETVGGLTQKEADNLVNHALEAGVISSTPRTSTVWAAPKPWTN